MLNEDAYKDLTFLEIVAFVLLSIHPGAAFWLDLSHTLPYRIRACRGQAGPYPSNVAFERLLSLQLSFSGEWLL